jgi:acyl dehydratase
MATLEVGTALPPYRVSAAETDEAFENKIHEDGVARAYGFRGGLVPGVVVYAWMTRPVVEVLGPDWLERGGFSARFSKPIYYGEAATVEATVSERSADHLAIEALARDRSGEVCARATFTLGERAATPSPSAYPAAPLPSARPQVTRDLLAALSVLGTPSTLVDEAVARRFLEKVGDAWPLYAGPGALVHPGFYLDQANKAVSLNVLVSPWVHAESEGRHFGALRVGERVDTRARVGRLFERRGHEFVELDCLLLAGGGRPVAQVRHVAIYKLRRPD